MTVSNSAFILYRPFQGYRDPGLPSGTWFATNAVAGDASGGFRNLTMLFRGSNQPLNNVFYSVERLYVLDLANSTLPGEFFASNFDDVQGSGGVFNMIADIESGPTFGGLRPDAQQAINRGHFLGRGRAIGNASDLSFRTNNSDTDIVSVALGGYWWSNRVMGVEGGPRRPVEGLYSV